MGRRKKTPSIMTSVRISWDLFKQCEENGICFAEAMRTGISMMLADRGVKEYDNNLNLYRKMQRYQGMAEEAMSKLLELKKDEGQENKSNKEEFK